MAVRYNQFKKLKGFGVGTIVPWSGDSGEIPAGWLSCTGGQKQVADYTMLYEIIGNTYGGTAGSTFGLPALTNGRAISDTYEGHYPYLKSKNSAHFDAVRTSEISSDPFWNQISNDINTRNNLGGQSVIDVQVIFTNPSNKPNLVATVDKIEYSPGSYELGYGVHPRKLSDRHQAQNSHSHNVDDGLGESFTIDNSLNIGGARASTCGYKNNCRAANTGCHTPITPGNRRVLSNASGCTVRGGSGANNSQTGMINDGDGVIGGDMYAAQVGHGGKNLATSMSNSDATTWSSIFGHQHSAPESIFKSNIGAQSRYTFYDINSSQVTIDQSPGVNVASININTATPCLTMVYIIKAF